MQDADLFLLLDWILMISKASIDNSKVCEIPDAVRRTVNGISFADLRIFSAAENVVDADIIEIS